ncbi:MAG TPA: 4a-hydroxytetrahydrobiopterin dehydratase [Bryobacteraceae bacterium]|nr:4a-hydroxytetrahydrobiopterin dehydratase [Bryobacteraceae bacterium]
MPGSRKLLSPDEVHQHAAQSPRWRVLDGKKLSREYTFPDFQNGLNFVNRVGEVAERQGHHPDIQLSWGRVIIETWTHDAGGLTEQDFRLASQIDQLS